MPEMDTARWVGGLARVMVGAAGTLTWDMVDSRRIGPVTSLLIVPFVCAAAVSLATRGSRHAWWAARSSGVLLGLDFRPGASDPIALDTNLTAPRMPYNPRQRVCM